MVESRVVESRVVESRVVESQVVEGQVVIPSWLLGLTWGILWPSCCSDHCRLYAIDYEFYRPDFSTVIYTVYADHNKLMQTTINY